MRVRTTHSPRRVLSKRKRDVLLLLSQHSAAATSTAAFAVNEARPAAGRVGGVGGGPVLAAEVTRDKSPVPQHRQRGIVVQFALWTRLF